MSNLSKPKPVDFRKGTGEYIVFVIISLVFGILVMILIGFIQLSYSLNELTKAVNVAGRAVAVTKQQEDAQALAASVVGRSVYENDSIQNVSVEIAMVDEGAEWKDGCKVIVSVSADIRTFNPFTSGPRTKKTLVTIEGRRVWDGGAFVYPLEGGFFYNNPPGNRLEGTYQITQMFMAGKISLSAYHSSGHTGTDIGAPQGTDILAAADGEVVLVGTNASDSYGYHVIIDHGNGIFTLYAHMKAGSPTVEMGDSVLAGDKIGEVGSTGDSTGPHLHFEVRYYSSQTFSGAFKHLNAAYFFDEQFAEVADRYYEWMWETNPGEIQWENASEFSVPGDPRSLDLDMEVS